MEVSLRFYKLSSFLLLFFLLAATGFSQAVKAESGKLVEVKVPAPSLKGNKLGDPTEQKVEIYLPPNYTASPEKRFPVLYLLHGFGGKSGDFTTNGYQGMNLQPSMDDLIKRQAAKEMIIVVPNASNGYRGSFYTNSEVVGNWEDFIYRDLVSFVDTNYRTIAKSQSRGVAGHSMGGYASIMLGMKYPDIYGSIYALSPCCLAMEADLGPDNAAWLRALSLKSTDQIKKPQTYEEFWSVVFVALSAGFSPNVNNPPFYVDFPIVEKDGKLVKQEPAYSKWQSKLPINLVEKYKDNLLKLKGIYIDYGQQEEFTHIRAGCQLLSKKLAQNSVPHTFEVYKDGDHQTKIRERVETKVLPFFSRFLENLEK